MILRFALAWIPMVFIAIANGAMREFTYGKRMSELAAHQISTITALFFFGIYIFILTRFWRIESPGQAITIGLVWLALTVAFEFIFGHYVAGHSWERLFRDYNIFAGRIWILVLIWITIGPYCFFSLNR
jgi:low affinity Fe/Cu permease